MVVENGTGKGKKARKRTASAGERKASRPERKALRPRRPLTTAADLRAILDAAERLYRAVHVAWARADLRERGVREVKVVAAPAKPAKVEYKRRAVPSFLPGDPRPAKLITCPKCSREFAEGVECYRCGTPDLKSGEECSECCRRPLGCARPPIHAGDPPLTVPGEERTKFCLRLGRGAEFCRFEPDHEGECEPRSTGVDPKSMRV